MRANNTLVIGGTSGIGKAICQRLVVQEIGDVWGVDSREFDVQDASAIFEFLKNHAPFTRVVYSAGINYLDFIGDVNMLEVQWVFDVNVIGFIRVLRALRQSQTTPARVLAVSSDASTRPLRTSIAYCASKAALDMAVRVAARELGPDGWRVNGIAPGMTADTGMTAYIDERVPVVRGWDPGYAQAYEESQGVIKRRATPEEVAHVAVDILTGPDYLNGSIVTINGGR